MHFFYLILFFFPSSVSLFHFFLSFNSLSSFKSNSEAKNASACNNDRRVAIWTYRSRPIERKHVSTPFIIIVDRISRSSKRLKNISEAVSGPSSLHLLVIYSSILLLLPYVQQQNSLSPFPFFHFFHLFFFLLFHLIYIIYLYLIDILTDQFTTSLFD